MRLHVASLAAVVSLLVAACGGDGGSGANVHAPSDAEPALDALCDLISRCPDFHPLATRNRKECIDVLYWVFTCRTVETNGDNRELRRTELTLTRAQSMMCASAIRGLSCDDLGNSLNTSLGSEGASCLPLVAGLGDDDDDNDATTDPGACQYSGQCPSGQYCPVASFDTEQNAPACRACRGPLKAGEVCEQYNQEVPCDGDLICVENDDGDHVCGTPLDNGSPCDRFEQCTSGFCDYDTMLCSAGRPDDAGCSDDVWCRSGYCHDPDSGARFCASEGKPGDACAASDVCLDPLTCIDGHCDNALEVGEPCTADDECAVGYCETDGRCGQLDGANCEAFNGACRSGVCNGQVCTPVYENGEPCQDRSECIIGWCDVMDNRCGIPDGKTCQYMTANCRSGFCNRDDGVCARQEANGQPCTTGAGCVSAYCSPESKLCDNDPGPLPIGAVCETNDDCASRLCSNVCYERCSEDTDCDEGQFCNWESQQCQVLREDGSRCNGDEECLAGYCNDNDQCQTKPGIGEACSGFSDCYPLGYCVNGSCAARKRPDASCDSQDSCLEPFICLEGTCKLPSLRCEPAPRGEQCAYFRYCAAGSYCELPSFTCVAQKDDGESCLRDDDCSGGFCDRLNSNGPTCAQAVEVGAACDGSTPCVSDALCLNGTCEIPEVCDDERACGPGQYCASYDDYVCKPLLQLGERCISEPEGACAPELYCEIDCEPRRGLNEECASYMPCLPELRCDSSERVCVPALTEGADCNYDEDCAANLRCDSSKCAPLGDFGDYCSWAGECNSGICFQDRCSAINECAMPGT